MWETIAFAAGYGSLGLLEVAFPKIKWALVRPAVSWCYTATVLSVGMPFLFKTLAIPHAIAAVLYFHMYKNDIAARYLHYPMLGSLVGYLLGKLIPGGGDASHRASMVVLSLHMHRVVVAIIRSLIFPAPLLGYFVDINQARAGLLSGQPTQVQLTNITASSGHIIDAMVFTNKNARPQPNTWIVYFGGNGEVYEHSAHTAITLAESLNANALCFNFRGVGRSTGSILRASDMISDAKDVINHLMTTIDPSTSERKILIYGHSIGGGVAAQTVYKHFPEASIVVDRSFSSLADAACAFMKPLRKYPGFVKWATEHAFGDFDTAAVWDKITHKRKLVTYHRGDAIIPYSASSFARLERFQKGGVSEKEVIELTRDVPDPHNYPSHLLYGHRDVIQRMHDFLYGRTLGE